MRLRARRFAVASPPLPAAALRRFTRERAAAFRCVPRVNVSRHRHYSTYYSDELAELVRQRYARDVAAFGYAFERQSDRS